MNKMKFIRHFQGIFITLLLCPAMLWAGITGKISGRVADAETGDPLPGANVIIVGTMLGAAADAEGDYFVINIPPGTYNVEATMIGYQGVTMTGVLVSTDNTTPLDFGLNSTAIELETVMVTAEREVISMDQSASVITATAEEIADIPGMIDISDFIALQAGIEGDIIRGGSLDQTAFMMDGLLVVDNRTNQPMMMVNLSAVKEISIIKGGFQAEYGNVRSGLINVVTKDGSMERYHGSADIRYSPGQLKHSGTPLYAWDNFYMRPFMDPAVMWTGTDNGAWDQMKQNQYKQFDGYNKLAEDSPSPDDTPEDWYNQFLWIHAVEGSGALGQTEMKYGDKPDINVDVSLGGPIPILPNLSFFTSYRKNIEQFGLPLYRDAYEEQNIMFKLTSQLTPSMKLAFETLNGTINTTASQPRGGSGYVNQYMRSGLDVFERDLGSGGEAYESGGGMTSYFPSSHVPFDIYRNMVGISLDHVLSPRTFYNIRVTRITLKHEAYTYDWKRDSSQTVTFIDSVVKSNYTPPADYPTKDLVQLRDVPYGFWYAEGNQISLANMTFGGVGGAARDSSEISTINVKFDITSQVNKYHQLKAGFMFNYDDIKTRQASRSLYLPSDDTVDRWSHQPYRLGAYIQDKLEFEGMIANFGLRLDYNEPNTDWFTLSPYSKYLSRKYMGIFQDIDSLQVKAKGHVKISPRIGISHPITETAKFFFNYGHFYSMPTSTDMYGIGYGSQARGVDFLGNPSAELPKTVAYELGMETTLFNTFLVRLMGYYKDVSAQTGDVAYENYDGTVDYETVENNNYEDIRGFEFTLERRFGQRLRGWLNYNYMVSTEGFTGRENYFQDARLQRNEGLQDPYQEIPLARPFARGNITFTTPDIGPSLAGQSLLGNIDLGLLCTWRAGRYTTWDPLDTDVLRQNLQWDDRWGFDARITKTFQFGGVRLLLFADIDNLFDLKRLTRNGFENDIDEDEYYESLHLPLYKDDDYAEYWVEWDPEDGSKFYVYPKGFRGKLPAAPDGSQRTPVAFNDKPGEVAADKSYIDMPNREFLWYLNPRTIFVGVKFEF